MLLYRNIYWNVFVDNLVSLNVSLFSSQVCSIFCVNMSICLLWMLSKFCVLRHNGVFCTEKNLDRNYTRMLQAILNKFCKQHPTKQQLYSHLFPISKTIKVRQRHVGHSWKSKDKFISNVLLWTPTHWHTRVSQPARTYMSSACRNGM